MLNSSQRKIVSACYWEFCLYLKKLKFYLRDWTVMRCLDGFVKEKKKEFDCKTGHKSFIAAKIFGITSTTPK